MPFLAFKKYILTVYYIMKRAEKQDFSPAGHPDAFFCKGCNSPFAMVFADS